MRAPLRLILGSLAAVTLVAFAAACGNDDDNDASPTASPDDPVTSPTDGPVIVDTGSALFEARKDLAARLQLDTRDVILLRLQPAGFNGCLGLIVEDQPCTEQFISGYIAFFSAGDEQYRYHFGGNQFLAVDFLEGEPDDGLEVPAEMALDIHRILAAYAREDAALREGEDVDGYVVTAIVPTTFPDGCIGFDRPDTACDTAITPGAIILIAAPGGTLTYHVSDSGLIIATDFEDGDVSVDPDAEKVAVQQAMRDDLAERTASDVAEVTVVSYRDVTWPDGCIGISRPGTVCTQALVDGFLALLTDASGEEFRYHGTGSDFIAASFEDGATLNDPLPPGQAE